MSEHHDLKLLELTRAKTQRRNRKRTPKQQIHERDEQEAPPPDREREARLYGPRTPPLHHQPNPDGFAYPTGSGPRPRSGRTGSTRTSGRPRAPVEASRERPRRREEVPCNEKAT